MNTIDSTECIASLVEAINSYRLGMEGQGGAALTRFIDQFTLLLEKNSEFLGQQDSVLINEIVSAQMRSDYTYMADLLQYEIPKSGIGIILGNIKKI